MLLSAPIDGYRDSNLPRRDDASVASSLAGSGGTVAPSPHSKSAARSRGPGTPGFHHHLHLKRSERFCLASVCGGRTSAAPLERIGRSFRAERLPGRAASGRTGESARGWRPAQSGGVGRLPGAAGGAEGLHSPGRRLNGLTGVMGKEGVRERAEEEGRFRVGAAGGMSIWEMSPPQSASFGDWDPEFEFATCLQPGGLEGVTSHRSPSSAPENRTVVSRACLAALAGVRSADQLPGVGVGAGAVVGR